MKIRGQGVRKFVIINYHVRIKGEQYYDFRNTYNYCACSQHYVMRSRSDIICQN